ncbi:hypothetical protein DFH09DRAFT_1475499 [Mycena vulgaris]|nr:hypothetical protein DFH09DRAFT_1475499 [Mycena vulgaris]
MDRPGAGAYTPCAPAELWRLIFRLATTSATSYDVDYEPFQPLREMAETASYLDDELLRFKTCLSLMCVSRLWRLVAAEFLYEDVRIMNFRSLRSLVRGLQRSRQADGSGGFGRYIRRLELPMRQTNFTQQNSHLSPFPILPLEYTFSLGDLLRLCPRLEILVRPCLRIDAEDITFWASLIGTPVNSETPLLPHLKRLEWYETDLDTRFYGNKNTARLSELIAQAPSLQYLFISSDRPDALAQLPPCPSLYTLRLNRTHFHAHQIQHIRRPCIPYCPNLTNLILHTSLPSSLLTFVSAVGAQLRILELAFSPQFVFSSNQMQRILSRCPALEELSFYLGAPEISPLISFAHCALRRVRLKLNPDEWYPYKHVLKSQFAVLDGASFPGLKEVILHDGMRSLVRREAGVALLLGMVHRGCRVVYDDGEAVSLTQQANRIL